MKDLSAIFEPRSVAIVGASANPVKWGCIIPSNILMNSFDGGIYLINPKGEEILGMEVYKNIKDVPGEVDLAIIVRPSETCLSHIEECVNKGAKSIILLSGGFSEEEIVIYSSLESTANILAKMFGRYKYLEW